MLPASSTFWCLNRPALVGRASNHQGQTSDFPTAFPPFSVGLSSKLLKSTKQFCSFLIASVPETDCCEALRGWLPHLLTANTKTTNSRGPNRLTRDHLLHPADSQSCSARKRAQNIVDLLTLFISYNIYSKQYT